MPRPQKHHSLFVCFLSLIADISDSGSSGWIRLLISLNPGWKKLRSLHIMLRGGFMLREPPVPSLPNERLCPWGGVMVISGLWLWFWLVRKGVAGWELDRGSGFSLSLFDESLMSSLG